MIVRKNIGLDKKLFDTCCELERLVLADNPDSDVERLELGQGVEFLIITNSLIDLSGVESPKYLEIGDRYEEAIEKIETILAAIRKGKAKKWAT